MNFGCDDHMFSGNLQVFEDFSKDYFCITGIVYLCSIEMIDAIFESHLDDFFVFFVVLRLDVDHVAERDGGNLES